jgi:hypothetical protein
MSLMRFDLLRFCGHGTRVDNISSRPSRVEVHVDVSTQTHSTVARCVVDTGATVSLFSRDIAGLLGLTAEPPKMQQYRCPAGSAEEYFWVHTVNLRFAESLPIRIRAWFSADPTITRPNLLGMADVLDGRSLCINSDSLLIMSGPIHIE